MVLICIVNGPHEDLLSLHRDIVYDEDRAGYFAIKILRQSSTDNIEGFAKCVYT